MTQLDYPVLFQKPRLHASSIICNRSHLTVPVLKSITLYHATNFPRSVDCHEGSFRYVMYIWAKDVTVNIGIWTLEYHFGSRLPYIGNFLEV